MGRKSSVNLNLPPRLRIKKIKSGVTYYYDLGGKPRIWMHLGHDYVDALRQYAELEDGNSKQLLNFTFQQAVDKYFIQVVPTKAEATQKGNHLEIKDLLFSFGEAKLNEIEPIHIRQFLDHYANKPRQANKMIALFSHIFNCSREWGMTSTPNPCLGVKKHKTKGRDVYIDDALFEKVYAKADQPLRDYMDLIYLTGQRNADVLKADERNIINNEYHFTQNKTGKRLRIAIVGEFEELISRIRKRRVALKVLSTRLIIDTDGTTMSTGKIRSRFDMARKLAGVNIKDFQLRDLRAKAGTDKDNTHGMIAAQEQLGHSSSQMTQHYVRNRLGKLVQPTK